MTTQIANLSEVSEMQVKDMTVGQLKNLIRQTIEQCLDEYFGDPDAGLEIKDSFATELLKSLEETHAGERGIPSV